MANNNSERIPNYKINRVTFLTKEQPGSWFRNPKLIIKYNSSSSVALERNEGELVTDNKLNSELHAEAKHQLRRLEGYLISIKSKPTIRTRVGYKDSDGEPLLELHVKDTQKNRKFINSFLRQQSDHKESDHIEPNTIHDPSADSQLESTHRMHNALNAKRDKSDDRSI